MVSVFFTNTSATTALHSMNPLPHINNDPSTVSNELNDLIDAHLTTLTQQHAGVSDPSHPHSLLLRVLHQQFTEHLELQLYNLRQYTTHQQLLIHQFVGNSPPHYPNPNPDPNPDPQPQPQLQPAHHQPTPSATTIPLLRSPERSHTRHLLLLGRVPSPSRRHR